MNGEDSDGEEQNKPEYVSILHTFDNLFNRLTLKEVVLQSSLNDLQLQNN